MSRARTPLALEGELTIEPPHARPLTLRACGDRLQVEAASVRSLRALWRLAPRRAERRAAVQRLAALATASGVDAEVTLRGRRVGELRTDRRAGAAARLLGTAPFRICVREVLRSLLPARASR